MPLRRRTTLPQQQAVRFLRALAPPMSPAPLRTTSAAPELPIPLVARLKLRHRRLPGRSVRRVSWCRRGRV